MKTSASRHRHGRLRVLGSNSLCPIALAVVLQCSQSAAMAEQPQGAVTINMRDADIRVVAEWIAEQTHRKIILDPRVSGKVTVLSSEPMSMDQAYRVFVSALDAYGYSAVETDSAVRIVPSPTAKSAGGPVLDAFTNPASATLVTQVIRLHQISAVEMATILRPLISQAGYISALASNNTLVIADQGDSIKRLLSLIKKLDDVGRMEIEVISLHYATAKEVAALLTSMAAKPGPSGAESSGTNTVQLTVAPDERTNSILIAGDAIKRAEARDLISGLDRPLNGQGSTQVITLRYQDAKEMAEVLKSMAGTIKENAKDQTAGKSDINIVANTSTNAVVVTAPPAMMDEVKRVIERLDIKRRQVLVEAIIVEVNDDVAKELGVQWSTSMSKQDGAEAITNFISPDSKNPMVTPSAFTLGSGLSLGYYRNGSLRGLIKALATDTTSNLLSTPSIVTLENQEAEILVGSNVPLITGQTTGTSSTTTNPFTTIERKDIGVTLKITPKINIEDAITLDVLQEVENISDDSASQATDIVTNKRSIKTKVQIRNDDVIVLGGLIRDDVSDVIDKVPLLGDIPVVGKLFQSSNKVSQKRNLMVFLHPIIMDDEHVAGDITQQRYDAISAKQKSSGQENAAFAKPTKPQLPPLQKASPEKGKTTSIH